MSRNSVVKIIRSIALIFKLTTHPVDIMNYLFPTRFNPCRYVFIVKCMPKSASESSVQNIIMVCFFIIVRINVRFADLGKILI